MIRQVHVVYSGTVQGVGFRYTVRQIARRLEIMGWVRNLEDGRVEMKAEAEEALLVQFIEYIAGDFAGYITEADVQWQNPSGTFDGFHVKF